MMRRNHLSDESARVEHWPRDWPQNVHPAAWQNPRPASRYKLVVIGGGTAGLDAVVVDGATLRFHKALIATGSRPVMPTVPGLVDAGYHTHESIFDLTELPRRLLVMGGGPLGCEFAQAFCRFGSHTIIAQG